MADESVRSLLATLGFEVDTTGADQFEARFKKLGTSITSIATKIDGISPKFDKKKGKARGTTFGAAIKKAFLSALKIKEGEFDKALKPDKSKGGQKGGKGSPEELGKTFGQRFKRAFLSNIKIKEGGLKEFTESLKKGLSKSILAVKNIALAAAAAASAVAVKSVLKFKDVESAEFALETQTQFRKGVDFSEVKQKITDIEKETEFVFSKLDILQGLETGLKKTGEFAFPLENMSQMIRKAKNFNTELDTMVSLFSDFIQFGVNIVPLEKVGFFFRRQTEAIQRQGTGFGPLAQPTRKSLVEKFFDRTSEADKKRFLEYLKTTGAFFDQTGAFIEGKTETFGRKISKGAKGAIEFLNIDPKSLREQDKKIDAGEFDLDKMIPAAAALFEKIISFADPFLGRGKALTPRDTSRPVQKLTFESKVTQIFNNGDPETVRKAAKDGTKEGFNEAAGQWVKDAAQMELRKTVDKGLPLTAQ